jgi:excisionase family DNA binding protein
MPQSDIPQQCDTPKSINDLGLLLSVAEVQQLLGLGLNSTYNLIRSGQLKSIRVGKLIKVPRPALEEYLNSYKK